MRERGARHVAPSGAFNRAILTHTLPFPSPFAGRTTPPYVAALVLQILIIAARTLLLHLHRLRWSCLPPPADGGGGGGGAADGTARAAWPARAAGAMAIRTMASRWGRTGWRAGTMEWPRFLLLQTKSPSAPSLVVAVSG